MLFRVFLLTSAIVMAASQSVFGAFQMGAGTVRCGEWTRLRTFNDRQTGHAKEIAALNQVQAWVDGFISGINAEGERTDFLSSKPQSAALYAVVDSHCRASPLDTVSDAAIELVKELRKRAQR